MTNLTFSKGWKSLELAKAYFHNSELQRQCIWDLLGSYPFKGNESILDFGCRDGKMAAELTHFVKKGSVTAVDHSEWMIQLAKLYFPASAFPNLKFTQIHSLVFDDHPKDFLYDRIVSFYVFHLVADPFLILKNLYSHLKKHGELFMIIPTHADPHMSRAGQETLEKYQLPLPVSNSSAVRSLDWAREIFTNSGFKITLLESRESACPLADSHEMIQWMIGTFAAIMNVPFDISKPFFTEMFHRWIELDPGVIDQEGRVHFPLNRLNVIATK